jgi:hypothetical protein
MTKINLKLKQEVNLFELVPLAILSVGFFLFSLKIQSLPKITPEPQTITVSNDIPGTDLKLYRNRKYGFSLMYPKGYDYREISDASLISFYSLTDPDKGLHSRITFKVKELPSEFRVKPFRDYASVALLGVQYYESLYSLNEIVTKYGVVGYRVIWTIVWNRYPPKVLEYQSLPFAYFELVNTDNKYLEASFGPYNLEKDFDQMVSTIMINK